MFIQLYIWIAVAALKKLINRPAAENKQRSQLIVKDFEKPNDVLYCTWIIKDFKNIIKSSENYHTLLAHHQMKVCVGGDETKMWRIKFTDNTTTQFWIGIQCTAPEGAQRRASVEVKIPKKDGDKSDYFYGRTGVKHLTAQDNAIDLEHVIYRRDSSIPIVNGSLTIYITISEYTTIPKSDLTKRQAGSIEQLQKDMTSLYRSGLELSDFKIVAGDDKEFPVHKQVLAARSSVFAAMIQSDFNERKTGTVKVPDVNSDIMEIVLDYIYTGNVVTVKCLDASNLIDLAYAAEKYALVYLLSVCDDSLAEKCNKDNAIKIFATCKKLNLTKARQVVGRWMKVKLNEVNDEEEMASMLKKLETTQ